MRRVLIGVLVVLALPIVASVGGVAQEAPSAPAAFYGELTVGGVPAPAGTVVEARVDGETVGTLTTEQRGRYGGAAAAAPKLVVDAPTGDGGETVIVTVTPPDGQQTTADQTLTAEPGTIKQVALTAPFEPTTSSTDRPSEGDVAGGDGADDGSGGGAETDTTAPSDGSTQPTAASNESDDPQTVTDDDNASEPPTATTTGDNSGGILPVPGFGFSVAVAVLVSLAVVQAARAP